MPYQIQYPDLMQMVLGAQQFAQTKQAMEHQRYAMDKDMEARALAERRREAFAKAYSAQGKQQEGPGKSQAMVELAQIDPESAVGLEKEQRAAQDQQLQQEQFQLDNESKQLKAQKEGAAQYGKMVLDTIGQSVENGQINQQKFNQGMLQLKMYAAKGLIPQAPVNELFKQYSSVGNSGQPFTPEHLAPILQEANSVVDAWGDPEKLDLGVGIEREAAFGLANEKGNRQFRSINFAIQNDPEGLQRWVNKIKAEEDEKKLARAKAAGTTITNVMPGNVDPTKQMEGQLQQELEMYKGVNASAKWLKGQVTEDLFGYGSNMKNWGLTQLDKANSDWVSPKSKEFMQKKQAIITNGTSMLYDFILAMSGKAVTDAERAMILSAVGDPSTMSFNQYIGTLDAVIGMTDRKMSGKKDVLQEGIDVASPEARAMIDARMADTAKRFKSGQINAEQAAKEMKATDNLWRMEYSSAMVRAKKQRVSELAAKVKSGTATPEEKTELSGIVGGAQ